MNWISLQTLEPRLQTKVILTKIYPERNQTNKVSFESKRSSARPFSTLPTYTDRMIFVLLGRNMSSVPISSVFVRRLRMNSALAGKKVESVSQMAETESKQVYVQQKPCFNCLAGVHKILRSSTEKLLWLSPWKNCVLSWMKIDEKTLITKFQIGYYFHVRDEH